MYKCNYISIIYEKTTYGMNLFDNLMMNINSLTKLEESICVNSQTDISGFTENDEYKTMLEVLFQDNYLSSYGEEALIVYLGHSEKFKMLLQALNESNFVKTSKVTVIASEAAFSNDLKIDKDKLSLNMITVDTLSLSSYQSLSGYFGNLASKGSNEFDELRQKSIWLDNYMRSKFNCTFMERNLNSYKNCKEIIISVNELTLSESQYLYYLALMLASLFNKYVSFYIQNCYNGINGDYCDADAQIASYTQSLRRVTSFDLGFMNFPKQQVIDFI